MRVLNFDPLVLVRYRGQSPLAQSSDRPLLSERIYDTALGCGLALATTWVIFPSRWRRQD